MPLTFACLLVVAALMWEPVRFMLIGTTGAIFANATGAGGGVIFIPLFSQIGFSESQAISTSFGIQCFGMSAGAATWSLYWNRHRRSREDWPRFWLLVTLCCLFSIAGIWTNYAAEMQPLASLHQLFKIFSVLLGSAIFATIIIKRNAQPNFTLTFVDLAIVSALAYVGGILTGWLSVAVGEIIAFYLIFRRYEATYAIATAVIVTAFTVWSVAPVHLSAESEIVWSLVKYAGPGAIIGGVLARYLATYLPPTRLKLFFAVWLIAIGIWG